MRYKIFSLAAIIFIGCNDAAKQNQPYKLPEKFNNYWYVGKAEVASYSLQQARYGEIHEGNAVLIFVTEDFSKSKKVKLDHPEESGSDRIKILKMNFMKKFNTGIYPYSIMLSAFTPINLSLYPIKFSMSSQEWCGHVFTQVNLDDTRYEVEQYSYFESEGDKDYAFQVAFTEDEIWNRIRLDYTTLPEGELKVVPGLITTRLLHKEFKPVQATASLSGNEDTITYKLEYNDHSISIDFAKEFPHVIYGWQEFFYGPDGKSSSTKAQLKDTLVIDYWTKNKKEFLYLRDTLGLK